MKLVEHKKKLLALSASLCVAGVGIGLLSAASVNSNTTPYVVFSEAEIQEEAIRAPVENFDGVPIVGEEEYPLETASFSLVQDRTNRCFGTLAQEVSEGENLYTYPCTEDVESFSFSPATEQISHHNSGLCMALDSANATLTSNVVLLPCEDAANFQWEFDSTPGLFDLQVTVKAKGSDLCLTAGIGEDAHLGECGRHKWNFSNVVSREFQLLNSVTSYCLKTNVNGELVTARCSDEFYPVTDEIKRETWSLGIAGKLVNSKTGDCLAQNLDVETGEYLLKMAPCANILDGEESLNRWHSVYVSEIRGHQIRNGENNHCLDIKTGEQASVLSKPCRAIEDLEQYDFQYWGAVYAPPRFQIKNKVNEKCVDVPGESGVDNETPLQVYTCDANDSQKSDQFWYMFREGAQIRNTLSGKCMDVPGFAVPSEPYRLKNGDPIQLYDCDFPYNSRSDQRWKLYGSHMNGFLFQSYILNSQCIDVVGSDNAAKLQVNTCENAYDTTDNHWELAIYL